MLDAIDNTINLFIPEINRLRSTNNVGRSKQIEKVSFVIGHSDISIGMELLLRKDLDFLNGLKRMLNFKDLEFIETGIDSNYLEEVDGKYYIYYKI
jgi:hypothetical protein